MKILIDMNLSPTWVQFLLGHGIEAVHWSMIGDASAPDWYILDHAASKGFVVFTHDLTLVCSSHPAMREAQA